MQYTLRHTVQSGSTPKNRIQRVVIAGLLIGGFCCPVMAQEATSTKPAPSSETADGDWYIVTGRNVNIRCAPNISGSYSIGKLQKGDRVLVTSTANGWATIKTTGPSFKTIYGLLRADNKVKETGKKVEILSSSPLLAPNVATENDPIRSWKQMLSLKPGTTLTVANSFDHVVDGKKDRWLLVHLPTTATAYLNMAFLRPEERTETSTPPTAPEDSTVETVVAEEATIETTTETPAENSTENATDAAAGNTTQATGTEDPTATNPALGTDESFDPADGSSTGAKVNISDAEDPLTYVTIEQAEDAWKAMRKEGGADKEIETLQLIYVFIANNENETPEARRLAELRIRQLEMHQQVQERLRRLKTIEQRNTVDRNRMQNAQILIEARAAYDAVGRVNASKIYDGKRLPQLFRLQAPAGGRTIGYIRPSDQIDLMPMLGRLVGIVGPKNYDAGYRLMIVSPKRVDILTATADGE